MSNEIFTRIQQKYDTEANWSRASFIPKKGEMIVYAPSAHRGVAYKIGDGTSSINALKFVDNVFYATFTPDESDLAFLDCTFTEIQNAVSDGLNVIAKLTLDGNTILVPLFSADNTAITFGTIFANRSISLVAESSGGAYYSIADLATTNYVNDAISSAITAVLNTAV